MPNKKGNFYVISLLVIMFIAVVSLYMTKAPATGFAVKANKCFEGTAIGECSLVKPKYCDNGALKPDCQRCGCREDEFCQDDGTCLQKCADGTLFGYCSENKPVLCFKGTLLENCFKCGCFPGQICLNDGTCAGDIKVGAGAEEKKEAVEKKIIEKCSDGSLYGECAVIKPKYCQNGKLVDNCELCGCDEGTCSNGKCLKESPELGFWWNLLCKVFYSNEYDDCISYVAEKQNK